MNKTRRKQTKFTVLLLLLFFIQTGVYAQEAIPASGGTASGGGGSASYTIGQMAYTLNSGTSGSVSQGVQQPYEILVLTGADERWDIGLTMKAYPNPTTNYLTLQLNNSELSGVTYQLTDMSGRLLESKRVESKETTISMSHYTSSSYFLKVIQNNNAIKTFKIIKN